MRSSHTRSRPVLERLESRAPAAGLQPTVLEQVLLERLNDWRAGLAGGNLRPFAMQPSLAPFAAAAATTRKVDTLKNAMDKARIPWERKNSFTSGLLIMGSSVAIGTDPAAISALAEELVGFLPVASRGPNPLSGRPGNALYKPHRAVGFSILTETNRVTYRDLTVAYKGTAALVTGVVYRDANANGKYDAGEGVPGVTVSAGALGSTTAWTTGGYTLPVKAKRTTTITVVASGPGLGGPETRTVVVSPSLNTRLNFVVD